MTNYAQKYRTTLSQDEEAIAKEQYGRGATPMLFADRSVEGLIAANCPEKCAEKNRSNVWQRFAKGIASIRITP